MGEQKSLTIQEIITVIQRSNIKTCQDEDDYGYYRAHVDMALTFQEIQDGKRTLNGDWINDKNSTRSKRK